MGLSLSHHISRCTIASTSKMLTSNAGMGLPSKLVGEESLGIPLGLAIQTLQ